MLRRLVQNINRWLFEELVVVFGVADGLVVELLLLLPIFVLLDLPFGLHVGFRQIVNFRWFLDNNFVVFFTEVVLLLPVFVFDYFGLVLRGACGLQGIQWLVRSGMWLVLIASLVTHNYF